MPTPHADSEKLTRVKIEGYRSIRLADVSLGDVTVLIGANGAGKSNFISFLQMLGYIVQENLSLFVNERRGANSLLHYGTERTQLLGGTVEFSLRQIYNRYNFGLVPIPGDTLIFATEGLAVWQEGDESPAQISMTSSGRESELVKAAYENEHSMKQAVCFSFVLHLSSIRVFHFHNTTMSAPIRSFQNLTEDRMLLPNGGNLAVMLRAVREQYPAHYRRIVDEMRSVLPSFIDFVLEPSRSRGSEQIELRWRSNETVATLGPDQLSDGSIRAAALLTLLLQPKELKPSIIVIDEPELGLHPYAVGQIGRLIAEASTERQVIVSTQSPQLLSQFEPEQVVVVHNERGESKFNRLNREELQGWLDAYENDLGRLFEMNITGGAPE